MSASIITGGISIQDFGILGAACLLGGAGAAAGGGWTQSIHGIFGGGGAIQGFRSHGG